MKELELAIVGQLLKVGALPTTSNLAEVLEVTPAEAQEALDRLESIGMIGYGIHTPRGRLVSIGRDLIHLKAAHVAVVDTQSKIEDAIYAEHLRRDNAKPRG